MPSLYERLNARSESQWASQLPVFKHRNHIVQAVTDNQVIVITSDTGSGKTTQIPQFLAASECFKDQRIIITQPRRVAATSVARRVSEEVGCVLGDEVGYAIRFDDTSSSKTLIRYVTDGILLRESLGQSGLQRYGVVILDEAHERTLDTDILFGIMKRILKERPSLRLIVTSATLDTTKFSQFFGGCPIVSIPGRQFHVDTVWMDEIYGKGFMSAMLQKAEDLHLREDPSKGILVFLTGQDEIDRFCKELSQRIKERVQSGEAVHGLDMCPLHSQLPREFYDKVFRPAKPGNRKVVVATNIAETSVTVDGITFVIDCGLVKQKQHSHATGMDSLLVVPISKQAAHQRQGRAGRTAPGVCFRAYSKTKFDTDFVEEAVPEILRTSLVQMVLTLKGMSIHDVLTFEYVDAPPASGIVNALKTLYFLDAVDCEGRITKLGHTLLALPLEPPQGKLIVEGAAHGVLEEMIAFVSMMNADALFYHPFTPDERALADMAHTQFYDKRGDMAAFVHLWDSWRRSGASDSWCTENYLQAKAFKRAAEVRRQLLESLDKIHIRVEKRVGSVTSALHRAAGRTLYYHAAKRNLHDAYSMVSDGRMVSLTRDCKLIPTVDDEWPDTVVAYSVRRFLLCPSPHLPLFLCYQNSRSHYDIF
jgi:ATP-dependent RNA helicase DHX8/PRP22